MALFFKYLFVYCATWLAGWLAGSALFWLAGVTIRGFYARLFQRTLVGLVALATALALYYTRLHSVLLGFVVLGMYWWFFIRLPAFAPPPTVLATPPLARPWWQTTIVALGALAIFGWQYHTLVGQDLFAPHDDYVYYANLSAQLLRSGVESTVLDPFAAPATPAPYHYLELWLNGGISAAFGTSALLTLVAVTYGLLLTLTWLGTLALLTALRVPGWRAHPLALAALGFGGLVLPEGWATGLLRNAEVLLVTPLTYHKIILVYAFLVWVMYLFVRKLPGQALAAFVSLAWLFISAAPAVLAAVLAYAGLRYFLGGRHRPSFLLTLGVLATVAGVLLVQYGGFLLALPRANTVVRAVNWRTYATVGTYVLASALAQLVVTYGAVGLGLVAGRRQLAWPARAEPYEWLLGLTLGGTLGGWVVLNHYTEGFQFFSNLGVPLLNLTLLALAATLRDRRYLAAVAVMVAVAVVQRVAAVQRNRQPLSRAFVAHLDSLPPPRQPVGVYLKDRRDFAEVGTVNIYMGNPGKALWFSRHGLQPTVPLFYFASAPNDTTGRYEGNNYFEETPFYRFVRNQQARRAFVGVAQAQVDFIRQHRISYAILTARVTLSPQLQPLVGHVITDPATGERFVQFKDYW